MSAPEARCLTLPVAASMASTMAVEPPADWLASETLRYSVPSGPTTCPPVPVTWSSTTTTPVAVPPVPPDPGVGSGRSSDAGPCVCSSSVAW